MDKGWHDLRKELDRVEGRVIDFGTFAGWTVERVGQVNRGYLLWCLETIPLRHEVRITILRFLARSANGWGFGRASKTIISAGRTTRASSAT